MGGRASRLKGHNWEREVAYEHLAPIFGNVRRGKQTREGHDEADAHLPEHVPFWVECESAKRCDIRGKLRQAVAAELAHRTAAGGTVKMPVAILKDTHKGLPGTKATPPIVAMYLPDYLALLQEWWTLKTGTPAPGPELKVPVVLHPEEPDRDVSPDHAYLEELLERIHGLAGEAQDRLDLLRGR